MDTLIFLSFLPLEKIKPTFKKFTHVYSKYICILTQREVENKSLKMLSYRENNWYTWNKWEIPGLDYIQGRKYQIAFKEKLDITRFLTINDTKIHSCYYRTIDISFVMF